MEEAVQFQKIINYGINMFYKHTIDHKLTYVSPQCYDYLGCSADEAKINWTEFVTDHPINRHGFYMTQRAIETGETQSPFELQLKKRNGEIIWVLVNEAPEVVDGTVVGIVGALTDITNQKQREEQLQKLSMIASKTSDLIIFSNSDNEIDWVNESFLKTMGYSKLEVMGRKAESILRGEKTSTAMSEKIDNSIKAKKSFKGELINYKKNGEEIWLQVALNPVFDSKNQFMGFITSCRDISLRKKKEKKLLKSLEENDLLIMEMHHRVKNNLAVISAMLQLQAMKCNSLAERELQNSVLRIKTMANVHEQLYKSHEFKRIDLKFNIEKLISNILELEQPRKDIGLNFNGDQIVVNIEKAIPISLITNEVLTNSFKHAFKGRNNGIIEISISKVNNNGKLIIKDNGVGFEGKMNNINPNSLGMKMIEQLCKQIEADYKYNSSNDGVIFSLQFEI